MYGYTNIPFPPFSLRRGWGGKRGEGEGGRGGWVARWCRVNPECPSVQPDSEMVGQGPTALAVGADGGCFDIFSAHLTFLSCFTLSLRVGPIETEYCLKGPLNLKKNPTNQQTLSSFRDLLSAFLENETLQRGNQLLKVKKNVLLEEHVLSSRLEP